jgi:hypothetical protein
MKWRSRRIRDGYGDDLYVKSGHSMEAAQAGWHHARLSQTDDYLEHPAGKAREAQAIKLCLQKLLDVPKKLALGNPAVSSGQAEVRAGGTFIVLESAYQLWLGTSPSSGIIPLTGTGKHIKEPKR